ncbi:MAG: hypothetical protein ACK4MD_05230 [Demequina sp.]
MTVLDVGALFGAALLIALTLRVLVIYVVARIRLTDMIGYVTAAAGLLTVAVYAWDRFGTTGVAACVGGVVIAVMWTSATVRARKRDPDHELLGVFLIGKPPHAVSNWVATPARKD